MQLFRSVKLMKTDGFVKIFKKYVLLRIVYYAAF